MNSWRYFIRIFIFICVFYTNDSFLFKSRFSSIKIGSFNLRRYSISKATPANSINSYISKILERYDLVFLQEIIDLSNDNRVVNLLLNHLQKKSRKRKYEAIISPPLGSTSYKERFVYLYDKKSSKIKILSSHVYNGSASKMFERQPFILHVESGSTGKITFIGAHLKPDSVYDEFRHLRTVIDELKEQSSIILMGDFNADCSYLSNAKKKELRKIYFNEFQWLIDDRTETNLLESCSYDRIIVSSGVNRWKKVSWKLNTNNTFPFDKNFKLTKQVALQISDHYPVEVDLN